MYRIIEVLSTMAHLSFVAFTVLKPVVREVEPQKSAFSRLAESLVSLMPTVTRVAAAGALLATAAGGVWMHRRYKSTGIIVSVDPMMTAPEGAIQGSPILEGGRLPAGQVKLAVKRGNELMIVGSGLRMEDHLVTPTHNVMSGLDLYMITDRDRVRIDTANELVLAADVSAFPVPEASWALAGVSRIKMAPVSSEKTVTITSGCDQTYTIGRLRSTQPMGRVHYLASTKPGYSGSAYMDGQSCVGMHNHGGAMAGGYEILYMWCRLKHALQQIPESSEDFLRRLSKKKRLQFEDLDQDFSVIKTKSGHYHLATRQVKERLRQLRATNAQNPGNWADEVEEDELRAELASRRQPQQPPPEDDFDSDDDDNRRGYDHNDRYSDDDDYDGYEIRPQSYFPGEDRRPAMAPNRSSRQEPPRPAPRSRVAFAQSTSSAQPQRTGPQAQTSRQGQLSRTLPSMLREQSRRAGLSHRQAARMSAEFLELWRTRLAQPSTATAQQTHQPAQNARASTSN